GIRIQHPQVMIDEAQYGEMHEYLPPADYKLTYKAKSGRGVYSFCMCPGGYVVNSSSEPGRLCVNGMSDRGRDSGNANSAIVVTVSPEDYYKDSPLDGIEFQRELEERAYRAGGSDGSVPVQLFADYRAERMSEAFGDVRPCTRGKTAFADVNKVFPGFINRDIKEAVTAFGEKIKGFNRDDALIYAVESRTSSPVRIKRDADLNACVKGIYPCGEGAGYAGGITSAAMDGMRAAETIIRKYAASEGGS
ncbi:MAG: FAD-dependent oxidoreductase, partial [Lachnospiraceae bacterium]|nr:FAD-dependent oxidoreductase [Lachnospiraceae bacterium]